MKKQIVFVFVLLLFINICWGQSKVFKEVSADISSTMKPIMQEDALVGYLMFTQLEKSSKDSFNYRISIMDENLNDIGKVEFREKNLQLHDVSFEQDVLCLVYMKSDIADLKSTKAKELKNSSADGKYSIVTQLINLEGKIVSTNSQKVDVKIAIESAPWVSNTAILGVLNHAVLLKNIPGKGFALFYGDKNKNKLIAFDINGKEFWQNNIPEAQLYLMLTTSSNLYLMSKNKNEMINGGFEVTGFNVTDGKKYESYKLKDKNGNQLHVMGFQLDPNKANPVITGLIINARRGNKFEKEKQMRKGPYDGVFTIEMNGPQKPQVTEKFTYWRDGSKAPEISKSGNFPEKLTPVYVATVRDFKGNTYFVGRTFRRKLKVGAVAASVVTAFFIIPPIVIMASGTHKIKNMDAFLMKQDSLGRLSNTSTIELSKSHYASYLKYVDVKSSMSAYSVTNTASRNNFLVISEKSNSIIYNVDTRKIARKVPRYEGQTVTNIYPAKEGHIMVMEYNRAARETKLSIEALR